jgi:hypothetical protein
MSENRRFWDIFAHVKTKGFRDISSNNPLHVLHLVLRLVWGFNYSSGLYGCKYYPPNIRSMCSHNLKTQAPKIFM